MNAKQLDEVVHKTQELIKTPTCCQELKEMAEQWLKSVGSENEALMTQQYMAELKEDLMPIDNLIAFASSKDGQIYFGESKAKEIVRHSQEIQAQGAQYCDCPACAIVEDILKIYPDNTIIEFPVILNQHKRKPKKRFPVKLIRFGKPHDFLDYQNKQVQMACLFC